MNEGSPSGRLHRKGCTSAHCLRFRWGYGASFQRSSEKILVPYDFDEISPRALEYAIALAGKLGASITLLHVAEARVHGPHASPYPPPDVAEQLEAAALPELKKTSHGRRGVVHALLGSVAEKVLRTAPCPVLAVRGEWSDSAHAAS